MVEAFYKPNADRVFPAGEDNWNIRCDRFGCQRRWPTRSHENGYITLNEFGGQLWQLAFSASGKSVVDRNILTRHETGYFQSLQKWRPPRSLGIRGTAAEISDHRHCRLLRARSERPRGCCAGKAGYEFPPSVVNCHLSRPQ